MTLESQTYGHWSNIPLPLRRFQEIDGHPVTLYRGQEQGYTVVTDTAVWQAVEEQGYWTGRDHDDAAARVDP